jgi:predicted HTH transcriptional regulator
LENESIVNHLAKTVVSFLNTAGGIIFVGMKEDKDKMIQATGIKFKAEERTNFLYFMHDNIMRRVFPKTPEEQSRERVLTD